MPTKISEELYEDQDGPHFAEGDAYYKLESPVK